MSKRILVGDRTQHNPAGGMRTSTPDKVNLHTAHAQNALPKTSLCDHADCFRTREMRSRLQRNAASWICWYASKAERIWMDREIAGPASYNLHRLYHAFKYLASLPGFLCICDFEGIAIPSLRTRLDQLIRSSLHKSSCGSRQDEHLSW